MAVLYVTLVTLIVTYVNGTNISSTINSTQSRNISLLSIENVLRTDNNISPTNDTVIIPSNKKCYKKEAWNIDVFTTQEKCLTNTCAAKGFDIFELYISCNGWKRPEEPQLIGSFATKYALLRAGQMVNENTQLLAKQFSATAHRKYFTIEYGFLRKSFLRSFEPLFFSYNSISIKFPPTQLDQKYTQYAFTVFHDIYKVENGIRFITEETPLKTSLDKLTASMVKAPVTLQMNSKIVSFSIYPPKNEETYSDLIEITFPYRDYQNTLNHQCIRIQGGLGSGWWTNAGCHEHYVGKRTITCRCREIVGSYAVLSELAAERPKLASLKRDTITTLINIVCYVGLAVSISCIFLPYVLHCSHLGGMLTIYFFADLTLAIECLLLLVGVANSENVDIANLIVVGLHILQHAIMIWVILEGVHLYHGISPVYSEDTGMIFFYTTIAYGLPGALAGAGAGYNFNFTGNTQYIWPMASGNNLMYFILPTLGAIAFLLSFCWLLVYELLGWIGTKTDYLYERSVLFLKRNIALVIILAITHILGMSSMTNGGSGFYAYLFLAFFSIQIIMLFYFHFATNYEVWEWKEQKDFEIEMAKKRKEEKEVDDDDDEEYDSQENLKKETTFTASPIPIQTLEINNNSQILLPAEEGDKTELEETTTISLNASKQDLRNQEADELNLPDYRPRSTPNDEFKMVEEVREQSSKMSSHSQSPLLVERPESSQVNRHNGSTVSIGSLNQTSEMPHIAVDERTNSIVSFKSTTDEIAPLV